MPNVYRSSEEIVASRLEDGRETRLHLEDMSLFASGTFSNVYRGVARTESNHKMEIVIKKTWARHKGSPLEVKILGKLNQKKHKNIVRLLYSYRKEHAGRICHSLIYEYLPLNLHQFLKQSKRKINIVEVKLITWQLFRGQSYLQKMEVCHGDIKPQNLLFNADTGLLKIADFGTSSIQSPKTPQPSYHVTRFYRPPELLLGSTNYGTEIDTWSCGCVFGELLKGGVFLAGRNSINQAELVFDLLGKPTTEDLEAMKVPTASYSEIFKHYKPDTTAEFTYMFNQTTSMQRERKTAVFNTEISRKEMYESVQVLRQVLVYNPQNRLNGTEFLMNSYFQELFAESTVRSNGKKIGCLTVSDLRAAKDGDMTITNDSIDENSKCEAVSCSPPSRPFDPTERRSGV